MLQWNCLYQRTLFDCNVVGQHFVYYSCDAFVDEPQEAHHESVPTSVELGVAEEV